MKKPVIFYALIMGLFTILNSSCKDSINPLPIEIAGNYSVFAWYDLGMHCLNSTYSKPVILPPYNHVLVQLLKHNPNHSIHISSSENQLVLCAGCQHDPVSGIMTGSQKYLSQIFHGFHSDNLNTYT